MAQLTRLATLLMVLSITGCNVEPLVAEFFEPEVTELEDDGAYRLRVSFDGDDGTSRPTFQALLDIGLELCDGPFDRTSDLEIYRGFPVALPVLKDPAIIVDIKCGPSEFHDFVLDVLNDTAGESS